MTITEVISNIDVLSGKTVQVVGHLGESQDCVAHLFRNSSDSERYNRWVAVLRRNELPNFEPPQSLHIANVLDFKRKAAHLVDSFVVISGRVTNMCRVNGEPACLDCARDIEPMSIKPWSLSSQDTVKMSGILATREL